MPKKKKRGNTFGVKVASLTGDECQIEFVLKEATRAEEGEEEVNIHIGICFSSYPPPRLKSWNYFPRTQMGARSGKQISLERALQISVAHEPKSH